MARRKKKNNDFNWIIAVLAVGIFGWIAMDFYANVYRHPREESGGDTENVEVQTEIPGAKQIEPAREEAALEINDGLIMAAYRDDRYGVEFQYPTADDDARCPILEKTDEGFSLGTFYLFAGDKDEPMEDFIQRQLEGMEIVNREDIAIDGRNAAKIDYQTQGMGWYGSSVFAENQNRVLEFGLLANEMAEKCGGVDNYNDLLYQSVVSSLKFIGSAD
jgi:hypothetical protein